MVERQAQLELRIDLGTGFDLVELAELTDQLRQELLELDVLALTWRAAGTLRPAARESMCRLSVVWSSD
jgi:hypothetical protein